MNPANNPLTCEHIGLQFHRNGGADFSLRSVSCDDCGAVLWTADGGHIPDLTTAEVVPGEVMALVREALEDIVNDATTNPLTRGDRAYSIAKQALASLTRKA